MKKKQYKNNHEQNKEIGKALGNGQISTIAEVTGYSESYVRKVLKGVRTNDTIISASAFLINSRTQAAQIFNTKSR